MPSVNYHEDARRHTLAAASLLDGFQARVGADPDGSTSNGEMIALAAMATAHATVARAFIALDVRERGD